MRNRDKGVVTVYMHGRPNLLAIFNKWVDGYFSKKGDGYLDWRREYMRNMGVDIDAMYPTDDDYWDDEDYYESMGEWYNTHLNDDSYWNPSGGYHGKNNDDYYDDGEQLYPIVTASKKKKRGKNGKYKHEKGGKRHCKMIDISGKSGDDSCYGDDDDYSFDKSCYNGSKDIYYYDDYMDRFSFLKFNSIPKFKEYCDKRGITIPKDVLSMMKYRPVSHCCVNKNILLNEKRLMLEAEESYGSMVYSAATNEDIDNMGSALDL